MADPAQPTDRKKPVARTVDAARRVIRQVTDTLAAAVRTVWNKWKSRSEKPARQDSSSGSEKKTAKKKAAAVVSGTVSATTDAARGAFDKVIESIDEIATRQNDAVRAREEKDRSEP